MHLYFRVMSVDKATIKTRLRIHPDLLADPVTYIRKNDLSIRATKPTWGSRAGRKTRNLTLDVLAYKGIKVEVSKIASDPLAYLTINFNPGVCLHAHNGRILLLTEFLHALGLLANSLTPLLHDQKDWVDLVPGLRPGGNAYWSFLEIPFQCLDPDGALLARLRNLLHPSIRSASRHWPTSMSVGPKKGNLRLSIYLKAMEMVNHGKLPGELLPDYQDILRLETRMRDEKLVRYLRTDQNVEVIDGKPRLVRFFPEDLVRGHRTCFSELLGVFSPSEEPQHPVSQGPLASMGRFLADVANDPRTTQTFPELLDIIKHYTGVSADTVGKIRKAGLAELSRLSPVSRRELFSDAAYDAQFGIACELPEEMVCHASNDILIHPLIRVAYSPPGQPFHPHVELPRYER